MRFFEDVRFVEGVGWVDGASASAGATGRLSGEADIAMVSGLGSQIATKSSALTKEDLKSVASQTKLFVSSIPWWGWMLVGLGLAGIVIWLKDKGTKS